MRRHAAVLVLCLLSVFSLFAQDRAAQIREIEAFVRQEMQAQQMPGLSIAVRHGDFTWERGFGFADVENEVPATEHSSYRMASVTKPMTAVAILRLADEGKIDLDAEIQTYVPYFPKKAHPITIRQLLSHLGGISHYRDYAKEGRIREPRSTREAIAIFQDFDLVAEPGTRYSYTTYGYNLLGAAIETASGKSYGESLTESVWAPLGMTSTRMDDPRALIPHRVTGYTLENGRLRRSEYVDISSRFAGGGTRSTVIDMRRFLEGLAGGKVLKLETRERAWSMARTRDGRLVQYGHGFGIYTRNGRLVIAHSGAQQETRTTMSYIPEGELTIAIASNFEDARLSRFEDKLIEVFLGDPPLPGMRASTLEDDRALAAITSVFENGLAWYSRHGRAMTTDKRALDEAFRYFRASLGDREKIENGEHPVAGEPYTKIGSHIAAALAARGSLDLYHREGALRFVSDFAALPASRGTFEKEFLRRVQTWQQAWSRVWTPELRALDVTSPAALARLETLAGAPVKPDYAGDLLRIGERAALANDMDRAAKIAALGVSLYPTSPSLHGFAGVLSVLGGDRERGMASLRKSLELDPNGYASARNLDNIARGTPPPIAAAVRQIAKELHGK